MRARTRSAPWLYLLVLLPVVPLLGGCAASHYVEIYITEAGSNCECSSDMGQDKITNIYAYPGDVLVWINMTSGEVVLTPDSGLLAEVEYAIPSKGRAMTPVVDTASGSVDVRLTCTSGGSSGPVVVVGEPP